MYRWSPYQHCLNCTIHHLTWFDLFVETSIYCLEIIFFLKTCTVVHKLFLDMNK
uniref:Uncharacterized protein n=1 Tax=Anguilla anguilla TaxID=7936 RepID=A0A0E9XZ64_ANGAN